MTNRRETRASSIYRPRHFSFLYFLVLVSWSSHDAIECFAECHRRPLLKFPLRSHGAFPCDDLNGSSSAQPRGSLSPPSLLLELRSSRTLEFPRGRVFEPSSFFPLFFFWTHPRTRRLRYKSGCPSEAANLPRFAVSYSCFL